MSKNYILVQTEKLYTPKVRTTFVTLGEPHFFQGDDKGEYSVTIRVDPDEPEIQEWITQNENEAEILKQQYLEESGAKLANLQVNDPFLPRNVEFDEEENETGMLLFKFKARARNVSKKTGKVWENKIPVFDAKGRPITDKAILGSIGMGSVVRVSYDLKVYQFGKQFGSSLILRSAQIIELQERGGTDRAANDFAGMEEEGFEIEDSSPSSEEASTTSEFESAN